MTQEELQKVFEQVASGQQIIKKAQISMYDSWDYTREWHTLFEKIMQDVTQLKEKLEQELKQ